MDKWDAHTRRVTVAHVSSESGDHFLKTVDDWVEPREISRMVYESAPDWWSEPESVYVEDCVYIRFIGEG